MDMRVASIFWLLWPLLLWTRVYKYLFESLHSVHLGIYPKLELRDHMIMLCLNLGGTAKLFTTPPAPFISSHPSPYTLIPTKQCPRLTIRDFFNPKPREENPLFYSFTCSMSHSATHALTHQVSLSTCARGHLWSRRGPPPPLHQQSHEVSAGLTLASDYCSDGA